MGSKVLIIYNFNKLFEILNEIKENFNFEILNTDEKKFKLMDFNNLENFLIIKSENCSNIENCLEFGEIPIKLTNLIEKINLGFLKNQYNTQSELKIGRYILDLNSRKISLKNVFLDLTEKESELIIFMNKNKKVSLSDLQSQVWGYSPNLETHTVETHIYRLRKKMLKNFQDNDFIMHDRNGYFLN